jgi:hypothetical protein
MVFSMLSLTHRDQSPRWSQGMEKWPGFTGTTKATGIQ